MGGKIRLDRLIASQMGGVSRADVKKMCLKKRISVNGKLVRRSDAHVDTDDDILLDGQKIEYKKHVYIMLNKPQGVVCSTREGDSVTVLDLVPEKLRRKGLFPAGRLDKDTEGFVLLTDDGVSGKMEQPMKRKCRRKQVSPRKMTFPRLLMSLRKQMFPGKKN